MNSIRSIVWIGRGERFAAQAVADAPELDVVWERDAERALALALGDFDAVVLDAPGPREARGALEVLRRRADLPPVLVRLDTGADRAAVAELEALGAAEILCDADSPSDSALLERLDSLASQRRRRRTRQRVGIIGDSAQIREVFTLVEHASPARATVLLTGETGTGKELIARALHEHSPRSKQSFVAVNCAAFPETLLESELFGHTKGSFTGADRDHKGLFEVADGGTLFLDEVGETSGPLQAKLLRVLQEREVRAIGGARSRRVDVRVIAATNRDLRREASAGDFRADLYYRLAVFPIHIPPLRQRPADVLPLAEHFLELHGRADRRSHPTLTNAATHLLQSYRWPGNVRELENEIQRALAVANGAPELTPAHFSERLIEIAAPVDASIEPGETLRESLGRIEAWLLRRALDAHAGRRAATARHLGITREGLYKKMKRLNVE